MAAIELIKEYTKHKEVILTNRGNSAIKAALSIVKQVSSKKTILIPAEGGWLTYTQFPKKYGFEFREVNVKDGMLDLDDLKDKLDDCAALLYNNPIGYYSNQPIKEIYDICKGKASVILDVAGSLGDPALCDGSYADIIVGSFGRWKPVYLQYGGFISFNSKEYSDYFEAYKFDSERLDELNEKLLDVKKRLSFFYDECEKIKKELDGFDVIAKDKKGIVVVVRFDSETEKEKLIKYCENNNYEFTLCPRYIRTNDNAISIEVKRLEVE